jgi:hypothetical protein
LFCEIILFYFLDEPFVEIANKSTVGEFYELGKVHSVQCYVGGYPLPGVEWSFKQCSNYPNCDDSFIKLSVNLYNNICLNVQKLMLFLKIAEKYVQRSCI